MANKAVFCIAPTEEQAVRIVEEARDLGFSNDDISVLFPDRETTRDFAHERKTKAPEGAATGAVTGGVLGGIAGWLVGIGALAIPGIGPVVAAGALATTLGGAAIGAVAGGLIGALVGAGIPEEDARGYETHVREGRILITAQASSGQQAQAARAAFDRHGGTDVRAYDRSAAADMHR